MQECDLVMKGGLTSGVVYPHVVTEIAKKYRLRQIGGASAGAIAAVFAAAAEFERRERLAGKVAAAPVEADKKQPIGFAGVGHLANYLATDMRTLFQPDGCFKRVFGILMATVSETDSTLLAVLRAIAWPLLLALSAIAYGYWQYSQTGNGWMWSGIGLIGLLLAVLWIMLSLAKTVLSDLKKHDFGMCSGKTQPDAPDGKPAFGNWICKEVDRIAGLDNDRTRPLTIGDLEDHDITLASMTTDLSTGRPYQLPFKTRIHYFSKEEFLRLFDKTFVDYLCATGKKIKGAGLPKDDLYQLPVGRDFPVALAARMSLSFPGLIATVPLYRFDDQVDSDDGSSMRRCLFSDGGISSNFPIHFFDSLMPRRPTFGITLGVWEADRHKEKDRVKLEPHSRKSSDLPVREITSVGGFAGSILNTAKDWQDTLQSLMPGYADRIVTINLDPTKEGGMNLAMSKDTINTLSDLGRRAGKMLVERYSYTDGKTGFDQHRYNRALSLLPKLELALEEFAAAIDEPPLGAPDAMTPAQIMTEFEPEQYVVKSRSWRRDPFLAFARALAGIARGGSVQSQEPRRKRLQDRKIYPYFDARFRLIAETDRVPQKDAE